MILGSSDVSDILTIHTTNRAPSRNIEGPQDKSNTMLLQHGLMLRYRRSIQHQALCLSILARRKGRAARSSIDVATSFYRRDEEDTQRRPASRFYHATEKREIVPIIAVGALVTISYYSYRAMKRLNEDWEEYQYELHEYERWRATNMAQDERNSHKQLAIDFGTAFTKLAGTERQSSNVEVIITREGDRSFFNGIVSDNESNVTGRAALERYSFDGGNNVMLPMAALDNAKQLIPKVLESPLQSLEMEYARRIVTVPSVLLHDATAFTEAFDNNHDVFVPEPVAAVWGAQMHNLRHLEPEDHVLVVDVGGWTTQISIVKNHRVVSTTTLAFGGETFVECCVKILQQKPITDGRSLALLQWHSRSAVQELSTQSRVQIHVPYIFADPQQHHLEQEVARTVLEDAVEREIPEMVDASILSSSLPAPVDLKSWYVSAITRVLEDTGVLPNHLKACIVVGGASRIPLVQRSLQSSLDMLLGPSEIDVLPPFQELSTASPTSPEEWTVLGAASLAPSFGYSLSNGLTLNEES